jgi:hypothetical protein
LTEQEVTPRFFSRIGSIGGKTSKRKLTKAQARAMVRAREAKRQKMGKITP